MRFRFKKFRFTRSTTFLRNSLLYIQKNKTSAFITFSVFSAAYYFNLTYLRKYKGLRKLNQRFGNENQILSSKLNYFNFFFYPTSDAWAIVYPKNIQELQKIVKYANKYGLKVKNEDNSILKSSLIENQDVPYIIINQSRIDNFEFDESSRTVTVGVGLTIEEINKKLYEYNFYIPICYNQRKTKLFELINKDHANMTESHINGLSNIIKDLTVVFANGEALKTGSKQGNGVNFVNLFLGSNANLGISCEAKLKCFPKIKEGFKYQINFSGIDQNYEKYEYTLQKINSFAKINLDKICKFCINMVSNDLEIQLFTKEEVKLDDFEFPNKEKWSKIKCLDPPQSLSNIMSMRIDLDNFHSTFFEIRKILLNEENNSNILDKEWFLSIDILNGNFNYLIKKDELGNAARNKNFHDLNQKLINKIVNKNGLLIEYFDKEREKNFKTIAKLIEFGRNNLHLQKKMKDLLDPNNVFINEEYKHHVFE